jgi:hypothetical protein
VEAQVWKWILSSTAILFLSIEILRDWVGKGEPGTRHVWGNSGFCCCYC